MNTKKKLKMTEKFEKIVKFKLPFDKRTDNPNTNYGIGSLRIWFILKGEKGAVQIVLSTHYFLPAITEEYRKKNEPLHLDYKGEPYPAFDCWDIGFHSKKKPDYMDKSDKQKCNIIGECYYDGSSLRGQEEKIGEQFLEKGEDFIWEYLEKEYSRVFYGLGGERK
jgi:hypothetical protein